MAVIAAVSVPLAFARYDFPFGFFVTVGLFALFVVDCVRRRAYGRIALLICAYPAYPLLLFHLEWFLRTRKIARRSSLGILDGAIGFSDIGAYLCLMAYVACVSLAAGWLARRIQGEPELKRAAKRVALIMPFSWAAFLALAIFDPFGALGYLIR